MSISEQELKNNLLRFIMYTLTERCDNPLKDIIIDEAVLNGQSSFSSSCNVITDYEKKIRETYKLTISLEKVK